MISQQIQGSHSRFSLTRYPSELDRGRE